MSLKLCRGKDSNLPLVAKFIQEQKPEEVKALSLVGVLYQVEQFKHVLFLKDSETQEIHSLIFTTGNYVRLIVKHAEGAPKLISKFKQLCEKEGLTSWQVVCNNNVSAVEKEIWEQEGALVISAILQFNVTNKGENLTNESTGVPRVEQEDSPLPT
jgi:hypothetical protein